VGELTAPKPAHEELLDNVLAGMHQVLTGCEPLRIVAGAGSNTKVAPARVVDYVPCEDDVGGLFDDASRAKKAYAKTKALATGVAAAAGAGSSSSSGSGGGNGLALPAN
jgi:digalactosyldiacylglycerol synthase